MNDWNLDYHYCRDFNIDLLVPTIHSTESEDIIGNNNLELRSPLEMTSAQGNSENCLDYIFSDNPNINKTRTSKVGAISKAQKA